VKKVAILSAVLLLFAIARPCGAQETGGGGPGPISLQAAAGTLGVGVAAEMRLSDHFGLGLGGHYFKYNFDFTADAVDYNADLRLGSGVLLAHWYPLGGNFRISGGLAFNGNEIEIQSKEGPIIEIGGTKYDLKEVGTLTGTADFNSMAPYLGLGFGPKPDARWGVTLDLGVLFQGSPKVTLAADGLLALVPDFLLDLEEEEQAIEDELKNFQYYPILALGIFFRF